MRLIYSLHGRVYKVLYEEHKFQERMVYLRLDRVTWIDNFDVIQLPKLTNDLHR